MHRIYTFRSSDSIQKDLSPNVDKPLWPLSSFAPSKYAPTFITGLDESPEELRVRAALAAKNGTVNEYVGVYLVFLVTTKR
jgi:nucleoporin NUP42